MNMKIKIREQAGTDAVRKFDYQMAVALDYLLSEINNDTIVLIETLEDFAVFHNWGSGLEQFDIYQVKTKDRGLYSKSSFYEDDVIGKIILTDFLFDSAANTLNIICNTALKGKSTEVLDDFILIDTLTSTEIEKLKKNVKQYLDDQPDFVGDVDNYWGKLVYIKSSLPFSAKDDRYVDTLVGKTNRVIADYLSDEDHTINPYVVFNTLKLMIDKQRRNRIEDSEIEVEDAIKLKGISTSDVKQIIDIAASAGELTKKEILQHAASIFSPEEYSKIKQEYPTYITYGRNLADQAFVDAKKLVSEEFQILTLKYKSLDEVVRQVSYSCEKKLPFYSLPVIQILSIVVVYS